MNTWVSSIAFAALATLAGCQTTSRIATPEEIVFYSDRPSFAAAVPNPIDIDFHLANADRLGFTRYTTPEGLTAKNVRFVGVSRAEGYSLDAFGPNSPYRPAFAGNPTTVSGPPDGYLLIHLPPATYAFGFEVFAADSNRTPADARVILSTGHAFAFPTLPAPRVQFVGFTAGVAIESVRIESAGTNATYGIANFVYAAAPAALKTPSAGSSDR